jgi:hypothetical protein
MREYQRWHTRVVCVLFLSDVPTEFMADALADRKAMRRLYRDGYAPGQVLRHFQRRYCEEQEHLKQEGTTLAAEKTEVAWKRAENDAPGDGTVLEVFLSLLVVLEVLLFILTCAMQ